MFDIYTLNKRRTWPERLESLKLNLLRLVVPIFLAAVATVIWCQCRRRDLHLPDGDREMFSTAVLVLAAVFAIAAALLLTGAWERSRMISRYILTHNKKAFMEIRDEKIPIAMHLLLAIVGLLVVVLLGAAEYKNPITGGFVIFSTSFAISLYFVVMADLQEPTRSVWFRRRIPPDWLTTDIDAYFETRVAVPEGSRPRPPAVVEPPNS